MAPQEVEHYLRFIIHLFQSFEAPHVSRVMLQLVKIQLWNALSEPRREIELVRHAEAASYWKKMTRKDQKAAKKAKEQVRSCVLERSRCWVDVCAAAAVACTSCSIGSWRACRCLHSHLPGISYGTGNGCEGSAVSVVGWIGFGESSLRQQVNGAGEGVHAGAGAGRDDVPACPD